MIDTITHYLTLTNIRPDIAHIMATIISIVVLFMISFIAVYILRYLTFYFTRKLVADESENLVKSMENHRVFLRLAYLIAGLIFYLGIGLFSLSKIDWMPRLTEILQGLAEIYMLIMFAYLVSAINDGIYYHYRHQFNHKRHPIRSYLQVIKLFIWIIVFILIASVLTNKSPWTFLASLGALSAVLLLVFKDTILGFVTNIQASVYDIVRVGDWITIPQYHVDGNVLDISINTVKVQNFDKTVMTIPIAHLMTTGVQNWRGMTEAGGRRIKRAIHIDIDSIKFCDTALLENIKSLDYMKAYLDSITKEITDYNQKHQFNQRSIVNGRQLTNIGLFRQYIKQYLQHHPKIQKSPRFTFLIRQLQSTETGLPLEVYVFTTDTNWGRYEEIQADIFDHLMAALKAFDLRAFQIMSSQTLPVSL
ncbi:MAG: mechanosensitive ion channel domain-containing protein [Pseudomonadota bacterium]